MKNLSPKESGKIQSSTTSGYAFLISQYYLMFGNVPLNQIPETFMSLNGGQVLSLIIGIGVAVWEIFRDESITPVFKIKAIKKK